MASLTTFINISSPLHCTFDISIIPSQIDNTEEATLLNEIMETGQQHPPPPAPGTTTPAQLPTPPGITSPAQQPTPLATSTLGMTMSNYATPAAIVNNNNNPVPNPFQVTINAEALSPYPSQASNAGAIPQNIFEIIRPRRNNQNSDNPYAGNTMRQLRVRPSPRSNHTQRLRPSWENIQGMKDDIFRKLTAPLMAHQPAGPAMNCEGTAKLNLTIPSEMPTTGPCLIGEAANWDSRNLVFDIRGLEASYLKGHIMATINNIVEELNVPMAKVGELTSRLIRASARIDIITAELGFELIENNMVFNQVLFAVSKPMATKKSNIFTAVRQRGFEASRNFAQLASLLLIIATVDDPIQDVLDRNPRLLFNLNNAGRRLWFIANWATPITTEMFHSE